MSGLAASKRVLSDSIAAQRELLLQAWRSAFSGKSVVYLSGPITTGARFVDWFRKVGRTLGNDHKLYSNALQLDVIRPNEQDVLRLAERLRRELVGSVLEPASLHVAEWSQADYIKLWVDVIEHLACKVVMMPGWQFSKGCAAEIAQAFKNDIPVESIDGYAITLPYALTTLREAVDELQRDDIPIVEGIATAADALERLFAMRSGPIARVGDVDLRKDESLDRLAEWINVAQFVSFLPNPRLEQAYSRVLGFSPNHKYPSARAALEILLQASSERSINIRSFDPDSPQNKEFIYGIKSLDDALFAAKRLAADGLHVIANETVDVRDGGVSGVVMGDVIEFSPDDTPRCVEKPGVASLPRSWGIALLATVYGFMPDVDVPHVSRLEFSIHPKPRGWRHTHTLGWEYAPIHPADLEPKLSWPNNFSQLLGDKVFGLLIAHHASLPVPRTTVLNRRVAPFTFGLSTDSSEVWLRTAPLVQIPGKFPTSLGWIDPFQLVQAEDPAGDQIASIIAQSAVRSTYSGAAIVAANGSLVIEGKAGEGESLMRGVSRPEKLPQRVRRDVEDIYRRAEPTLGPIRFEWVHDGEAVWLVQLHRGATQSTETVLVPGEAQRWITFDVREGLEALCNVLHHMEAGAGLILSGDIGLTSHIADVIRKSSVPARIATPMTPNA